MAPVTSLRAVVGGFGSGRRHVNAGPTS